jgi:pimeloyl-ACP methyl ester carboxylesterase
MNKRKTIAFASLIIVFVKVLAFIRYAKWRRRVIEELRMGGQMAATAAGLVEYARAGEGPTVLYCHGGGGGCDRGELLDSLTCVGFSLLTPSRPGYLGTPLNTGQTPEEQADALAALLDRLGIEKTAVIGGSAGGPAALQLALRHPDRVWGLVMQAGVSQARHFPGSDAAVPGPPSCGLWFIDAGLWLLDGFAERFPVSFARMALTPFSQLPPDAVTRQAKRIAADPRQMRTLRKLVNIAPLKMRQAGLRNDLAQMAQLPRYPLERIETPTLVIHGRFDTAVPYEQAQFVADAVPNADLITLENSGHFIWLDDDWKKAELHLVKFLKDNAPE